MWIVNYFYIYYYYDFGKNVKFFNMYKQVSRKWLTTYKRINFKNITFFIVPCMVNFPLYTNLRARCYFDGKLFDCRDAVI